MRVALVAALCCATQWAWADEQPATVRDDLDVTMQIIVDPDAKLPDEVIRKIPLPTRTGTSPAAKPAPGQRATDPQAKGRTREEAAQELDRGMSERAKEHTKDAAEQREQASRSAAEERRRNPPKPDPPKPEPPPRPNPPGRP